MNMSVMIPLAVPNLGRKEREYVNQALDQNWVGPDGPFVRRFEELVAQASGRKWAVATITGSAAIYAAAWVLDFAGKPVKVPRFAFPAARHVFTKMGCAISLVDGGSDHDTMFYRAGDYLALCDRAPAIGEPPAPAMSFASLECYSFAANKTVTCGHGGAVVGDNNDLRYDIRSLIRQGHGLPGRVNYRIANLNAALGCAQMERLDELKEAKRRIWGRYAATFPMRERGTSRWMATADIQVSPERLAEAGIEARAEPSGGISLPCSTGLSEADQYRVIGACDTFLRSPAAGPTNAH